MVHGLSNDFGSNASIAQVKWFVWRSSYHSPKKYLSNRRTTVDQRPTTDDEQRTMDAGSAIIEMTIANRNLSAWMVDMQWCDYNSIARCLCSWSNIDISGLCYNVGSQPMRPTAVHRIDIRSLNLQTHIVRINWDYGFCEGVNYKYQRAHVPRRTTRTTNCLSTAGHNWDKIFWSKYSFRPLHDLIIMDDLISSN